MRRGFASRSKWSPKECAQGEDHAGSCVVAVVVSRGSHRPLVLPIYRGLSYRLCNWHGELVNRGA